MYRTVSTKHEPRMFEAYLWKKYQNVEPSSNINAYLSTGHLESILLKRSIFLTTSPRVTLCYLLSPPRHTPINDKDRADNKSKFDMSSRSHI